MSASDLPGPSTMPDPESQRLSADERREMNWKRWGPYLSERQWGTVREDYSADGNVWSYFPHDHARSRAYRWGEDGLLGICDRECRLCFAVALWNGRDPILKERLFGLSCPEGNHGEDVKEEYYYLDSTPTHSYLKALYKYPQAEFPYDRLVQENAARGRGEPEFELADTGVFEENRYFDVLAEYAKASPDDILIRLTVTNRGPETAPLYILPTLWFRNAWSWGCTHEGCEEVKPRLMKLAPLPDGTGRISAEHATLGRFLFFAEPVNGQEPRLLFTENETNLQRLYKAENYYPAVKDGFHHYVIRGWHTTNPAGIGTKSAAYYGFEIPAGASVTLRLRLLPEDQARARSFEPFGTRFDELFAQRIREADRFYSARIDPALSAEQRRISRLAYSGLFWNKQFYHYVVSTWLEGDPAQPVPPESRKHGRNSDWTHLFSRDVISMPDKWEYPWYAAWDLAFQMVALAEIDPALAKEQLVLLTREWYMHPNGQLPAYEFNFADVNPPVHAWACWRVYKITGRRGQRDRLFLERTFQKLMLNFTWWVNRKDIAGRHLFAGGFLGLDNIGMFDRSKPLPNGQVLEQADGTAWMAFYCATMLAIALELAGENPAYEDIASKFFEHFIAIVDAMNALGGTGLWDEKDGFYYDQLAADGTVIPLRIRSLVGIIPLLTVEVLEEEKISSLPGFHKRMSWFLEHRPDLAQQIACCTQDAGPECCGRRLLSVPSRQRLLRVLRCVLDEAEFYSPFGVRSMSRYHLHHPCVIQIDGKQLRAAYCPGDSDSALFGGNSNWRGPVWFPINYLLVEALERYHHFYGDSLKVDCPTGSGRKMNLLEVSRDLSRRMTSLFLPDATGHRPSAGGDERYARNPGWRNLVLFHEFFDGDTGRGLGSSHQTGWTALVARLMKKRHGAAHRPPRQRSGSAESAGGGDGAGNGVSSEKIEVTAPKS